MSPKSICSIAIIWSYLLGSQLSLLALPPLPVPPSTGTPKGNNTPGTTRLPSTCPTVAHPLTALVANRGNDFTTRAYPTLWIYVPYTDRVQQSLEFSLFDGRERQLIYRTPVALPDRPGIVKIQLPQQPASALALSKTYRWYLNFRCVGTATPTAERGFDLFISGWIERVQPERSPIWYDAIDDLATQHFADPTNPELNTAWSQLLATLNAPKLVAAPFVETANLRTSATQIPLITNSQIPDR